ncbi:hypothetical protein GQ53DRAFT_778617 [Thozetella sp. PMI_491]|nr:hypothetical protein GQ53DRAFT_778617 [Thozetella sp. PMI_491]
MKYEESHWGITARITVRLPAGEHRDYFLKTGRIMCEGEYESLKAIAATSPRFCPEPFNWGWYVKQEPETYFLLLEFRTVQPAEPLQLAAGLADLHFRSQSPTGNHFGHIIGLAGPVLKWPEFDMVAGLTLEKVIPQLLLPFQLERRTLKPCLVHGDCWDGNTAMDAKTGEAFVFDVCSFYGHNEYDTGNWRAPRHRLSNKEYIQNYNRHFPVSEPGLHCPVSQIESWAF